ACLQRGACIGACCPRRPGGSASVASVPSRQFERAGLGGMVLAIHGRKRSSIKCIPSAPAVVESWPLTSPRQAGSATFFLPALRGQGSRIAPLHLRRHHRERPFQRRKPVVQTRGGPDNACCSWG